MIKNPWFRLYAEFAADPKIQSMDETLQRRYIMLLCLQCNGDLSELDDEELACALRISHDELQKTKKIFIKKGFVDESWNIVNWDKRQYVSDKSTDRVRRYRERKKDEDETLQKRSGNGSVTPSDTDTDTDTEKKRKSTKKKPAKRFKFRSPTLEEATAYCELAGLSIDPQDFIDKNEAKGWVIGKTRTPMKDWKATMRTWDRNKKEWEKQSRKPDPITDDWAEERGSA